MTEISASNKNIQFEFQYVCAELCQLEGHKYPQYGGSDFGAYYHTELISLFNNFFFPLNYAFFYWLTFIDAQIRAVLLRSLFLWCTVFLVGKKEQLEHYLA